MQSQIDEPTFCEDGHGMMIPTGVEFCYAPAADGLVTAMVKWLMSDGEVNDKIYAPNDEFAMMLQDVDEVLGEWIYAMQQAGKLFDDFELYHNMLMGYRIEDNREGHMWSYLISLDEQTNGPRLMPRTVYHFVFEDDVHEFPALTDFDDVVALLSDPSSLVISDINSDVGKKASETGDGPPECDLDGRVIIWDLGAIQLNLDHSDP